MVESSALKSLSIVLLLFALHGPGSPLPGALAQDTDPLGGQRSVVKSNELVLYWVERSRTPVTAKLYDFVSFGNPSIEDSLQAMDRYVTDGPMGTADDQAMDIVVADFTGTGTDRTVAVWEGPGKSIVASVPGTTLDTSGNLPRLAWQTPSTGLLKPAGTLLDTNTETVIRLVAGSFDDDAPMELVLAYTAADSTIRIQFFELNGDALSPFGQANLGRLPFDLGDNTEESGIFDLTTGDLDDDGSDELLLGTARPTEPCAHSHGCWETVTYAYAVSGGSVTLMDDAVLFQKNDNSDRWLSRIAVETGDYDGDGADEVAVGFHVPYEGAESRWYLQQLDWTAGAFSEPTVNPSSIHQTLGSRGYGLSLIAGDLDFDGRDELVYSGRTLVVYASDSTFAPFQTIAGGPQVSDDSQSSRHFTVLADVDGASGLWYSNPENPDDAVYRPEIVTVRFETVSDDGGISVDGNLVMEVYKFTSSQFNLERIASKSDERSDGSGFRTFMLAAGDFGDRGIRLGPPRLYRRTDILQPLVVLNAPPVHFDVFDGTPYDVSGCYSPDGCSFSAVYNEQSTQTVEVTSEVVGDWQIGAGIEGGLNEILGEIPVAGEFVGDILGALGLGIDFSFDASYGEGFSDLLGSSRSIRLTTRVETFDDDAIYANIVQYDIWEYPLFVRGRSAGHIAIVLPRPQRAQWFTSKTPEAAGYIPNHQVGHILSYPTDDGPRRQVQQAFRGSAITLSTQTLAWDVNQESQSFTESTRSTHLQVGGDVDISLPIPTLSLNLNGDYSTETFNTHRTQVSNIQGITVNLGAIQTTLEGKKTSYTVTPFVYWDTEGAIVLDYAVDPSIAGPGEVETWWQTRYGSIPDPAFSLPELYEDLKTGVPVDEATRARSRSIGFSPSEPGPGDPVTLQALVHNYSLTALPNEVPVRFYNGDPAAGGTPITGVGGVPDPRLPPIGPRESALVRADWTVPASTQQTALRIYAVVDPAGSVTEIHEDNNKGWAPLRIDPTTGTDTETPGDPSTPGTARLEANYPNPFSLFTTIPFSVPRTERVRLRVFDLLGREVALLIDGEVPAGQYATRFAAAGLASGLYVVRLETTHETLHRTLVLTK